MKFDSALLKAHVYATPSHILSILSHDGQPVCAHTFHLGEL